jgi:hypothetical protein
MSHFPIRAQGEKLFFGTLLFLSALIPHSAIAAGVTIVTHGFEESYPTWVTAMGDDIPIYYHARFPGLDTNFSIYRLTITSPDGTISFDPPSRTSGAAPSSTESGEIVIELDWSALSGSLENASTSTYDVAAFVSQILMATNSFPELNGRPAIEFPIHLVGHSRGGSLMAQISYDLGTNGIWIDQLTTLDPYPLNNDGNLDFFSTIVDAPAQYTYENVLFADNYWQDLGAGVYELDPDGEAVNGAYVRQLDSLSGGYWNVSSVEAPDHSNAHLWYHGTIDLSTPASDTSATITSTERAAWWVTEEQKGTNAGFEFSLIGGGNRTSTNQPMGAGFSAIVDGYNQRWNFGAGSDANRTLLPSNRGTWPNLIQFKVIGTNVVTAGQMIATKFYYQYGGDASNATAQFFFDSDFNPYNTNSTPIAEISLPNTGVNSVYTDSVNLTTINVPPGVYAIYGKISDGAHTRYLYTPEMVQIVASPSLPVLGAIQLGASQFVIGVSGGASGSLVLQTSTDLQTWLPLATNTLTTGGWNYTNNAAPNVSQQFYRVVLLP